MLKSKNKHKLSFTHGSSIVISQGLMSVYAAMAEVVNRAHGRCAFFVENQRIFDGHCVVKHKQLDNGNDVVAIKLDNGDTYKLRGKNLNNLHIEAWDGVHKVKHSVNEDKEVFAWSVAGQRNRLVTKMDTKHKPDVSVNDNNDDALGVAIGALAGALIGGLISGSGDNGGGGGSSSGSSGNTPQNLYGTTPRNLSDLVGARAGQAEGELKSRGYKYRNTQTFDGGKSSYYVEPKTGYCVEVGTVQGRYSSIVYNSSDRCAQ